MKIVAPLSLFALAACAAPANDEASSQGQAAARPLNECDAMVGQYAVGKPFTDALAAELKTKVGANSLRVVPPGMMVTMDFRGDRLNINYDKAKIITNVSCG